MKTVELYDISAKQPLCTRNIPFFCRTSEGNYYVKFTGVLEHLNSGPWFRALINEFVSAEIALLMELPIPEPALVKVKKRTSVTLNGSIIDIPPSINFGSKAIEGWTVLPLQTPSQLRKVLNIHDFLPIMVFDAILHNVDRDMNNGNVLVASGENDVLYIIDHGGVFGASEVWDRWSLRNDQDGKIIIDPPSMDGVYSKLAERVRLEDQVEDVLRRLNKVNEEKLHSIIQSVPPEWGLEKEDADALLEYLLKRFQNGEQYMRLITEGGIL